MSDNKYKIRIFVENENGGEWKYLRQDPKKAPYQFDTERDAARILKMTYPDIRPEYTQIIKTN